MRRGSKRGIKIPIFADEDKVERIKLSYNLHRLIRASRIGSKRKPQLDKDSAQEEAFHKLAAKLDNLSVDDVEGYVGSAFQIFDPVYPNMLLSGAVEKHFFSTIEARKRNLEASFFSAYNEVTIRRFQLQQHTTCPLTAKVLVQECKGINPLFLFWYCVNEKLLDIPEELPFQARVAYYLWPLGYYGSEPWRYIVDQLHLMD